jgi:YggT family protein
MTALLYNLVVLYILVIVARMILSWLPIDRDSPVAAVSSFVYRITEPVMGPLRRAIPPVRIGNAMLDLSPLILLFVLQFVVLGILS